MYLSFFLNNRKSSKHSRLKFKKKLNGLTNENKFICTNDVIRFFSSLLNRIEVLI